MRGGHPHLRVVVSRLAGRRRPPARSRVGRRAGGGRPGAVRRGLVVRSASAEARAEGVAVGLRRREAEARCAGLMVLDADDTADARAFELVVRAVEELVPRLVLERPGQLSFPTRGPSRYFGGDDAFAARDRRPGARARAWSTCASASPTARSPPGSRRAAPRSVGSTRWWCRPGSRPRSSRRGR